MHSFPKRSLWKLFIIAAIGTSWLHWNTIGYLYNKGVKCQLQKLYLYHWTTWELQSSDKRYHAQNVFNFAFSVLCTIIIQLLIQNERWKFQWNANSSTRSSCGHAQLLDRRWYLLYWMNARLNYLCPSHLLLSPWLTLCCQARGGWLLWRGSEASLAWLRGYPWWRSAKHVTACHASSKWIGRWILALKSGHLSWHSPKATLLLLLLSNHEWVSLQEIVVMWCMCVYSNWY